MNEQSIKRASIFANADDAQAASVCVQIVKEDHVRSTLLPSHVTQLTVTHLETHSVLLANCIENGILN